MERFSDMDNTTKDNKDEIPNLENNGNNENNTDAEAQSDAKQKFDQDEHNKVLDAIREGGILKGDAEGEEDSVVNAWKLKSSDVTPESQDSLLGCLVAITKHYGRPLTSSAISAGMPKSDDGLTPADFVRVADKIDFSSRIVRKNLKDISELVLPAVLLLSDKRACLLVKIYKEEGELEVIVPESGDASVRVSIEEMEKIYYGSVIFIKPKFQYKRQAKSHKLSSKGHWFWGTLSKFVSTYSQVAIATILINVLGIASALFSLVVYDKVVPNVVNWDSAKNTLIALLVGMAFVVTTDFLLKTLRSYFVDNAGKRVDVLLSSRLFEQVLNIKMSSRPGSSGGFAARLREYETLREFFTSATMIALIDLPFIIIYLIFIYRIGNAIVFVPILAIPIVLILGFLIQYPLRAQIDKVMQNTTQKQGVLVETIQGLETVKSIGAEGIMQKEWENFVGESARSSQKARFISQLGINTTMMVQQLVTVSVVTTGVYLVYLGKIQMGSIIACSILVGRTMQPLAQIAGLLQRLHQSLSSLKHLNEVMELPTERPPGYQFLSRPLSKGEVEFKDVTFSYPDASVPAIKNVSFKVRPGERVAFLGPIGSGKSTVSRLIIGLFEPTDGSVLIDGTDVRQIDPADLRRGIGTVMQDVVLFHGSVRENIAMSAPYADDQMILNASRMAGADDFISQNPDGYGMQVGERGQALSGGQRQSIALARALLTDPTVLLMDEPTSMMDMASERQFVGRLKQSFHDKTLLIITHRPSLFQAVDRLIVLGHGEIKADGPRDEILNRARSSSKA